MVLQSRKFLGFGHEHTVDADSLKGRFANFMPEKYPNAQTRDMALEALAKLGVMVNKPDERQERGQEMERGV